MVDMLSGKVNPYCKRSTSHEGHATIRQCDKFDDKNQRKEVDTVAGSIPISPERPDTPLSQVPHFRNLAPRSKDSHCPLSKILPHLRSTRGGVVASCVLRDNLFPYSSAGWNVMKLGCFWVLTWPQTGQCHTQGLSSERANQLGQWRMTKLLRTTNGQWTTVCTEISPQMPASQLLSWWGAGSGLWGSEYQLCSSLRCDLVQLPHCRNFTFGVHDSLWMPLPTLDLNPHITHALFIFQNITQEIFPNSAAIFLFGCLKERQLFSNSKLMQTCQACNMTHNC